MFCGRPIELPRIILVTKESVFHSKEVQDGSTSPKKCKVNRGVPVRTTLTADRTIILPHTRISKPLCEVDVNVPTPSRRAVGSEGLSPRNSETQNIISPVRTHLSGYQASPNTCIFESQFRSVPIRSARENLQQEEVDDEHIREASNALNGRRMYPGRPIPRTQGNFGVTNYLLPKNPLTKKPTMQMDEWSLSVGEMQKAFESQIRGLTKLYLSDVHIMWPILKKSNALAEVMKALMQDFPGPWDYGEIVKKIGEITRRKIFEFRKAAMTGGKILLNIECLK
jgi:hypothetical protein